MESKIKVIQVPNLLFSGLFLWLQTEKGFAQNRTASYCKFIPFTPNLLLQTVINHLSLPQSSAGLRAVREGNSKREEKNLC